MPEVPSSIMAGPGVTNRPTEVWFRNPQHCVMQLAQEGVSNVIWDRGLLRKRAIDPQKHFELHYPAGFEYRILVTGTYGTVELRRGGSILEPYAVYPTWTYGNDRISDLERLLANPVGENEELCSMPGPPDRVPVFGQEHRVVIAHQPNADTYAGRALLNTVANLQEEYPRAIIHMHGYYRFRPAFTYTRAGDIEVRTDAAKGKLMLGSGKVVHWEDAADHQYWVNLQNMSLAEMHDPKKRCIFNIRSSVWAGQHFDSSIAFSGRKQANTNVAKRAYPSYHRAVEGDKFACDYCSLQLSCKLYRTGGVCTIPDSEAFSLAKMFNTRDSDRIIDGLGRLLETQVERAERSLASEVLEGELDPEVTRILNSAFANGVKLAKLVNPALAAASAPKIGVQINQGQVNLGQRPNVLTSAAVAALEAQGISRADITPEMIVAMMQDSAAIEVKSREV